MLVVKKGSKVMIYMRKSLEKEIKVMEEKDNCIIIQEKNK